jgi:hypothetical protein
MKCFFCNKKLRLCNGQNGRWYASQTFRCGRHKTMTVDHYVDRVGWFNTTIYWYHRSKEYRVNFFHGAPPFLPGFGQPSFRVECSHNKYESPFETIFELDFLPDITPENLEDKLPLWIAMS